MSQCVPDRPGTGSLRRSSDRLRSAVGWALVVVTLGTLVVGWLAATAAYRDGLDRIADDAAARTTVVGVLLDDAAPVGSVPDRSVRVSYVDPLGRTHVGQVPVTGRLLAGTSVRVEVDGDGRVGVRPPSRGDALLSAVAVAVGVALLGGLLIGLAWLGVCRAVSARNRSAWEQEWRRIEPQWSGRGTAAA